MENNNFNENFIKCIYEIKKEDLNKEINIINNGYYQLNYVEFKETNKDIENKLKIVIKGETKNGILKYQFNKEGIYTIYNRKRKY